MFIITVYYLLILKPTVCFILMRLVISSAKFSDPLLVLNNHSCEKASLVLSVSLAISFYHSFSLCLSVSIYLLPRRLTKVPGTAGRPVECAGEQHQSPPGNSIVLHCRLHRRGQRGGVQSSGGEFCGAVCHRSPPAQCRRDQGAFVGLPAEREKESPNS